MTNFIIRRLMIAAFILFLLSIATFTLLRITPGDAALISTGGGFIPQEQVDARREEIGLNNPYFPIGLSGSVPFIEFHSTSQYGDWARGVLTGDLGKAQLTQKPVSESIVERLPATIQLLTLTMIITILVGVPAGVISAVYRNSPVDFSVRIFAILALSIPSFWLATMVLLVPGELWGYAPPKIGTTINFWENPADNLRQFVPPALILGLAASATIMRLTRSSLLEVMQADYVRTARAKGLQGRVVVYRHALKNVLIPVITVLGLQFTGLLGGSLFIELIFSIKGLGLYTYEAILRRDYIVVQSMTLYIGAVVVLTQLAVDITYAWIDPRIRYT